MHLYDVIVVGAGISGCLTASNLSRNGLKVLLIDKNSDNYNREKICIAEKRALELLDSCAADSIITSACHMKIIYTGSIVSYKLKEPGLYLLDASRLSSDLYNKCMESYVSIRKNEHVIDIKIEDYYVEVRTDAEVYRSKYLVGADGVNTLVGRKAGIISGQRYCIGIEALYKTDKAVDKEAEIDFSYIPYGYSMALSCNGMMALYAASFSKGKVDIKRHFGNYIASKGLSYGDACYIKGNLIAFNNGIRQNYVNKRVMLVGDAARVSNPLTASVLYYAVRSSILCSDMILNQIGQREKNAGSLAKFNKRMDDALLREVRELYPLSRLVYNNKEFFFRLIKHVPYMSKYFTALLCGKINYANGGLTSLVLPWKGKNCIKDIGIIK